MKTYRLFFRTFNIIIKADEISWGSSHVTLRRNGNPIAEFVKESIVGWEDITESMEEE